EMIRAAQAAAARRGGRIVRGIVGRAAAVAVPDGSLELVAMGESLPRFDQPVVLRKVLASLQPSGYVAALGSVHPWQDSREPWQSRFREAWDRWAPAGAAAAHPAAHPPGLPGGPVFAGAGVEAGTEGEVALAPRRAVG